jgi:hypothetical protein
MAHQHQLTDDPTLKGLINVAIEIAAARRQALQRMRSAVEAGDRDEVFKIAREFCGLDQDDQTRN